MLTRSCLVLLFTSSSIVMYCATYLWVCMWTTVDGYVAIGLRVCCTNLRRLSSRKATCLTSVHWQVVAKHHTLASHLRWYLGTKKCHSPSRLRNPPRLLQDMVQCKLCLQSRLFNFSVQISSYFSVDVVNRSGQPHGKPGEIGEFDIGRGKVREIKIRQGKVGKCGLPVVCYHSCDSYKINITRVLLSKVDMHKMDCQQRHNIHSGVHVCCVYLWWFNKCYCLWEIPGKVREFDEDWRRHRDKRQVWSVAVFLV